VHLSRKEGSYGREFRPQGSDVSEWNACGTQVLRTMYGVGCLLAVRGISGVLSLYLTQARLLQV
jgi:hypothetical protein